MKRKRTDFTKSQNSYPNAMNRMQRNIGKALDRMFFKKFKHVSENKSTGRTESADSEDIRR